MAVEKVTVLGLFKNKAMVIIDGKKRILKAGETSPEGVKLISSNSNGAVLEVDGRRAQYGLGHQIGGTYAKPRETSVRIWPNARQMYLATGSINGQVIDFLVDTGATLVSMNSLHAKRLGLQYKIYGEPGVSTTASGYAKIYLLKLKRVKLGDIELTNVDAAVHDGEFPPEVLLGMSFLGQLDMSRKGGVLELRQKH